MDMDWCWRAVCKGWLALVDHGVVIEHLSGATRKRTGGHGIDRGEIMAAVLKAKWGNDWQAKLNREEAVPWTK
jgi:GT2 family glycosyltransferase